MPWYIFSIVNVALAPGLPLAQRWAMSRHSISPKAFAIGFMLTSAISAFLLGLVTGLDLDYSKLELHHVALTIVMNVVQFWALGMILKRVDASIYSLLINFRTVWILLISWLLLDATLTPIQLLGSAILLVSVIFAVYKKGSKLRLTRSELSVIALSVMHGALYTNDSYILRNDFDVPSYLFLVLGSAGLILAVVDRTATKELVKFAKAPVVAAGIIISATTFVGSVTGLFLAVQATDNAALPAVIVQAAVVLTVLGGVFILGERDRIKAKIAAALIAVVGLILINI